MLIFALISLLHIALLLGTGTLVVKHLLRQSIGSKAESTLVFLIWGMVFQFLVFLVVRNLWVSTLLLIASGLLGVFLNREYFFGIARFFKGKPTDAIPQILIFFLYFALIALTPVHDWDAQSSWFFHAKIFFNEGGLLNEQFLTFKSQNYWFAQFDYPKFFSWLSSFGPQITGIWNEHLPKLGIVPLFLCFQLGLAKLAGQRLAYWFLLMSITLSFHKHLWNGYMDAYVAILSALGFGFLMLNIQDEDESNILPGLSLLMLSSLLKNEGLVLACISIGAWLLLTLKIKKGQGMVHQLKQNLPVLVLGALPTVIWWVMKSYFALNNWLASGDGSEKIDNKNWWAFLKITKYLIYDGLIMRTYLLLGLTIGLLWVMRRALPKKLDFVPSIVGLLYLGVLYIVFLSSPFELGNHLWTTYDRVSFAVRALVFVSIFMVLRKVENRNV